MWHEIVEESCLQVAICRLKQTIRKQYLNILNHNIHNHNLLNLFIAFNNESKTQYNKKFFSTIPWKSDFFFFFLNVLFSLLILIDTMQVLDHVVFSNLLVYLFTFMCDSHTHFECFPKTIQALLDTSRNFWRSKFSKMWIQGCPWFVKAVNTWTKQF